MVPLRAAAAVLTLATLAIAGCIGQADPSTLLPPAGRTSIGGSTVVPDIAAEGATVTKLVDSVEVVWQGEAGFAAPPSPLGIPLVGSPSGILNAQVAPPLDHAFTLPPEVTVLEATLTWANDAVNLNLFLRDDNGYTQCRSTFGIEGEPATERCRVVKAGLRETPADWVARVALASNAGGLSAPEPFELKLNLSVGPFPLLGPALAPADRSAQLAFENFRVDNERRSAEPSLKVDGQGNVYIAAPTGKMESLWRTADGGATFEFLDINARATNPEGMAWGADAPLGRGGGDSEVFVTEDGSELYFADLWGTCMSVGSSGDAGETWMVNPLSCELPGTDRQWLWALPGGHLWMTFNGASAGNEVCSARSLATQEPCGGLLVMHSLDAGRTWPSKTYVPEDDCARGNLVVDAESRWYVAGCNEDGPGIAFGDASNPLEYTWVTITERSGEPLAGFCYVCGIFTVVDLDTEGNPYVVWADPSQDEDGFDIWLSSSQDRGATWSEPALVNKADGNAVLPWIAANEPGHVAIAWYQTKAKGSPDDLVGEWYVHLAESTNALDASPVFAEQLVSAQPVQYGPLCLTGSACMSARNLLDFLMVDIDHHGVSHVAYTDGGLGGSAANAFITYARMTGGLAVLPEDDHLAGDATAARAAPPLRLA